AFENTLNEIIRRHEVLRTTFSAIDGRPVQVINTGQSLSVIELSHFDEIERSRKARQLIKEELTRSFDLSAGPLLRVTLLRESKQEHTLLVTMHHIISDAWSMGVLVKEVAALYEAFSKAKPSPLPELPIQYADFAHWQRQHLQGEVLDAQLAYWRGQLAGAPA